MTYHHRYPEEVRLDTINRAVAALKRRLIDGHPRIGTGDEGQGPDGPASGGAVEETPATTGRG